MNMIVIVINAVLSVQCLRRACRRELSMARTRWQGLGGDAVSAHCQVTGRSPGFGNKVSHSQRRTRRMWSPNIQLKTYYLPSENRRIRLRVSTKGIKVIDRDGIESVVARLRKSGERI